MDLRHGTAIDHVLSSICWEKHWDMYIYIYAYIHPSINASIIINLYVCLSINLIYVIYLIYIS